MELLEKLGISWSLLLAQVVNFGILLALLTFFVYRPLLALLDSRRERIARAMEEAKKIEGQAKEMEQARREQLAKIDAECGAYLENMRREAEELQDQILLKAKKEAENMIQRTKKQLQDEREAMLREILAAVSQLIVQVAAKVLEREFSPADEKRLLASVERELPSLVR